MTFQCSAPRRMAVLLRSRGIPIRTQTTISSSKRRAYWCFSRKSVPHANCRKYPFGLDLSSFRLRYSDPRVPSDAGRSYSFVSLVSVFNASQRTRRRFWIPGDTAFCPTGRLHLLGRESFSRQRSPNALYLAVHEREGGLAFCPGRVQGNCGTGLVSRTLDSHISSLGRSHPSLSEEPCVSKAGRHL